VRPQYSSVFLVLSMGKNRAEIFRIPKFVCFQGDRDLGGEGGELRMITVKCQQMAGT
jgi:hypothetical protein